MEEIEILVAVEENIDIVLNRLSSFEKIGEKETKDIYYFDPLRDNLKLNSDGKLKECCRVREKAGICYITYKVDHYNANIWSYSDEYETEVKNVDTLNSILSKLGLEELVTIVNIKHTFETPEYEIVVEEVENLGVFLEVEYIGNTYDGASVNEIKDNIRRFINELKIKTGGELNSGKPELLLKNKKDLLR